MTLAALERRYRASVAKTEALRVERNEAIVAAVKAGTSQADIARALNLTTSRVAQLTSVLRDV